jgi:uncharacterized RDD family membrane protein YckC
VATPTTPSAVLDHEVREASIDGIITPEAVVLELETAGLASRLLAGIIDVAVQILLLSALALLVALMGAEGITMFAIVGFAAILGYPIVLETLTRGRTVGKKALGLRAVTVEGAPIRLRHAALRAFGGLVDRYLLPPGVVGILMVLATRRAQRVGDLLSGTIVVRDPDRTLLPSAVWFPVPPGFESLASTIDPTALTDEQYTVLRAFLMRNRELTPAARHAVAHELAQRASATLRHQFDPNQVHPEAYVLCVVARYQRRAFPDYQPTAWQAH